ncbi:MAG: hypothetical protein U0Q18_37685, partial [Bryobacteraceae bacterium]
ERHAAGAGAVGRGWREAVILLLELGGGNPRRFPGPLVPSANRQDTLILFSKSGPAHRRIEGGGRFVLKISFLRTAGLRSDRRTTADYAIMLPGGTEM